MALLVDGSSPSIAELERYEGSIAAVANTEGIDLGAKVQLVRDEVTTETVKLLSEQGTLTDPGRSAAQIVLTEPLRRWLVLESIASVYREARFGQVADRYGAKWKEYAQLAYRAKRDLMSSGVGICWNSLRKPSRPDVSQVAGSMAAGTYFVRVSAVNAAGSESEASEPAAIVLASAGGLRVTLTGATDGASGWDVYAGVVESEMALQNTAPLTVGSYWEKTSGTLASGRAPSNGQSPDGFMRIFNGLARG